MSKVAKKARTPEEIDQEYRNQALQLGHKESLIKQFEADTARLQGEIHSHHGIMKRLRLDQSALQEAKKGAPMGQVGEENAEVTSVEALAEETGVAS
jgi:hypothetical protein